MQYTNLLFDLDGTLTDPGIGITNSVMYALERFGIKETDRTSLYKFIGPPLLDSFRDFYGFNEAESLKALGYYREYFGVRGLFENEVYNGIPEVLDTLKSHGLRLFVATSKPTEYSVRILEKFDLIKYFEYVSGSAMDENNSAKSMIIDHALTKFSLKREETLMIGDRMHDINGAKLNHIDSAGVAYGYGSVEELTNAGADIIYNTVEDLRQLVM